MPRILVADDNSNIHKMVTLALKDQGIDVVSVGNGEAAVRGLQELNPNLILADIFMPVRNGYEVCEFVKRDVRFSHIPVILLVGAFDPVDELEARRVGADGILKKPFIPPEPLIFMVRSALAKASERLAPVAVSSERAVPVHRTASEAGAPRPDGPTPGEPAEFAGPPKAARLDEDEKPISPAHPVVEDIGTEPESRATAVPDSDTDEMRFWPSSRTGDSEQTEREGESREHADAVLPRRDDGVMLRMADFQPEEATERADEAAPQLESAPFLELADPAMEWKVTPPQPARPATVPVIESETRIAPAGGESAPAEAPCVVPGGFAEGPDADVEAVPAATEDLPETGVVSPHHEMDTSLPAWPAASMWPEVIPAPAEEPSKAALEGVPPPPLGTREEIHGYEAPQPVDPGLVDAVVAKVVERMRSDILEIVTREILRPVVEAVVRRELEKR